MRCLLAGDNGGTKTDPAVFSAEKGPRSPLAQARLHSADYTSLEAMAREFLGHASLPVNRACFGVAGPVVDGRARLTDLPWVLEEAALREALDLPSARLVNDLEAIANAVPHLRPSELHTLSAGVPVAGGAIAVIAPGTGLGEAFLTREGADYRANPSSRGEEQPMELGTIGLGRMGTNMVRRLLRAEHRRVVYDLHPEAVGGRALIQPASGSWRGGSSCPSC